MDVQNDSEQDQYPAGSNATYPDDQDPERLYALSHTSIPDFNDARHELFSRLKTLMVQEGTEATSLEGPNVLIFDRFAKPVADYSSLRLETEQGLKTALNAVKDAHAKAQTTLCSSLTSCLADGSRSALWRLPYGYHGVLKFYLDLLATREPADLAWVPHALRLLSNCCADPEEEISAETNRQSMRHEVVLSKTIELLSVEDCYKPSLFLFMQLGAEDATFQQDLVNHGLVKHLLVLLDYNCFNDAEALDSVCDVLEWSDCRGVLSENVEQSLRLLSKASRIDDVAAETILSLSNLTSQLLDKDLPQLSRRILLDILHFLKYVDLKDVGGTAGDRTTALDALAQTSHGESDDHQTDQEVFSDATKRLTASLAKIATRTDAHGSNLRNNEVTQILLGWLAPSRPQLQICALLMFGNMAFGSQQAALDLLEETELADRLSETLKTSNNGLVLRAAMDSVQTLSRPPGSKELFGRLGMIEAMARSWAQTADTQLSSAALYHTRNLLHGCLSNVDKFMFDTSSTGPTLFDRLRDVFRHTQQANTRLECGLTALEAFHTIFTHSHGPPRRDGDFDAADDRTAGQNSKLVLESQNGPNAQSIDSTASSLEINRMRKKGAGLCHKSPDTIELLLAVINQGNPSLSTRTWLTLVLISHEPNSADVLYHELVHGSGSGTFRAALEDKDGQMPQASSNARVLLRELLKHHKTNDERNQTLTEIWRSHVDTVSR